LNGGPEGSLLRLVVITPDRLLVEDEADSVDLPGVDGQIGILPGHSPLLTALGSGEIVYRRDGRERRFQIAGGTAEIGPGRVLVFTENADDDIDGTAQG
jgi:F-type H+-transporting ATPase subunit epsilon